jgi:DNA-directed RNA polymerase subunit RPC12/RpoP
MLIMKCSKCDKYIKSELLVELNSIQCEHCGTEVAVKNVLVSSNGFTFDRNDLLKRFFRYRKLLDEVIDERNSLNENNDASEESKHSIDQFLSILQGMMTGARDNYRCLFDVHLGVDLTYNQHQCRGTFVNLSMEGACVELAASNPLPRVNGQAPIEFSLPDDDVLFKTIGSICWVQQGKVEQGNKHVIGLKFDAIDDDLKPLLWNFIAKQADNNTK